MTKEDFHALKCTDLSQKCFAPLIKFYKSNVTEQHNIPQFKETFYAQLTEGQRALFMFYAYYNHVSQSLTEFYWWSAYFMAQPTSWSAIKASTKYFKAEPLFLLLERLELELKKHNHPETLTNFSITRDQLNQNKELLSSIQSLHSMFEDTAPLMIKQINEYIEKNLQEFVEIE